MKAATLVFPHQLFEHHPALEKDRPVVMVEEWLFFRQYNFHRKKILLHRATMQCYKQWLGTQGYEVTYLEAFGNIHQAEKLGGWAKKEKIDAFHVCDVHDDWLRRRLIAGCKKAGVQLDWHPTPAFLCDLENDGRFFDGRKRYFQTDFYLQQRKKRGILLDDAGGPTGGKWTYDNENRRAFPKGQQPPPLHLPKDDDFVAEARQYVNTHFGDNYGEMNELFGQKGFYPVSFAEARKWLKAFLCNRFEEFGPYEDALVAAEAVLHHSVISPLLNTGLLTPDEVLHETLSYAKKNMTPLNSVEGFVRQLIGWREFIRIVYEREGRQQRTRNYWGFARKIPAMFWEGTTGIVPVDRTIKKVLANAYNHHIERLMVMGNFLLLCEFDPDEVYRWFMEMYIDAYDWVMVPNTYGMTQFADGGLMMTKPYISGSNYLMKMGDYPKGDWQRTWDGLFWRFMHVHRSFFKNNPRLGMLLGGWDKMSKEKQQAHLEAAEEFLAKLDEANQK